MIATQAKFLEFLDKAKHFVVPIYQRSYSWNEKQCSQLFDDILRTGMNDKVNAYFVGSIVYVEKGLYAVTGKSPLLVIDGQQRLTTVMLLIEAISRQLGTEELLDGFSAKKLRNYYLINSLEEGEDKYKLILSQTDKTSLIAVLDNYDMPKDYSIRIKENFDFFVNKLAETKDLVAICKGLAKLVIVDISLDRDQDNPQLIFESLNSMGLELNQADLIRNFVLMRLEPDLQTKLYSQYWRPMEIAFGQEAYSEYFDSFMRHYLTLKTGNIPKEREVYEAFKDYAISTGTATEELVADIKKFAEFYCVMALGAEVDEDIKIAFQDIRELKVDVAFPFLLEIYKDYNNGLLSKQDLLKVLRLTESYVFRRAVCGIPTNSMNKTFAGFIKNINKENYLENIQAYFKVLPSYRRFPDDAEFKREFEIKDLYNFRSKSYWLRRLENYDRKERVPVNEYTIEHIMPQNENLSSEWREALGPEWERIQKTYLHTLGNLTLTGYNSEYSDRTFIDKRDRKGGFKESPIRINKEIAEMDKWNEDSIKKRAEILSAQAVNVWILAEASEEILEKFKPKKEVEEEYTIDNHPYLSKGSEMYGEAVRNLFESLRKEILALDPCVTETFLKLYVAYKAETNFVDVVPQAKKLRLTLNIPFAEIIDPKGLCRDISNLGRWGNGDVEVGISKVDEIPYTIGLIRQSFERQMGTTEE